MAEMVGISFTESTVIWNVLVVVGFKGRPSLRVTVIMALPFALATGVNVSVAVVAPGV